MHVSAPAPHIEEVQDISSGKANSVITPGGMVSISGDFLKVAGDDTSIGVYFVDSSKTEHKVTSGLAENMPSRLIFIAPTLSKGDYTLEVRTQYTTGEKYLKKPRAGAFAHTLTVQ